MVATHTNSKSSQQNPFTLHQRWGLLVVEDTHTSYMRKFWTKEISFMEYVKRLADRINSLWRFNNNLLRVESGQSNL